MKILQAYNLHRFGGGSDAVAMNTATLLRESGHTVHEFVRNSADLADNWKGKMRAFSHGLYAREAIQDFGRQLEAFRPDVVHVHELYPLISPWIIPVCRKRGFRVVMTCHDYRLCCPVAIHVSHGKHCTRCAKGSALWCAANNCRNRFSESLAYALRGMTARRFHLFEQVDHFITATAFAADWLAEHAGLNRSAFSVVPCPISIPESPADPALGAYVAYAGRFVPEKGLETLLQAIRKTGYPLHLAGDPEEMPRLQSEANVICRGLLSPAEMVEFYRNARMLIVPSTWFETFGLVAGEALAHGIPVIASRIGALAEVVQHEESGFLFPPGDADALAQCMQTLWTQPERSREMGLQGRETITDRCHPDRYRENLLRVYRQLTHCPY